MDKQNTRWILTSQNGLCFKITTDSTRSELYTRYEPGVWIHEFLATNNNNGHAIVMKMSQLMMHLLKTKVSPVSISNYHVTCRHLLHVFS